MSDGRTAIARLALDGGRAAVLYDGPSWECPDPSLARSLGSHLAAADRSPARGDWLRYHATRMAELLGAEIEMEEAPPDPPDARH